MNYLNTLRKLLVHYKECLAEIPREETLPGYFDAVYWLHHKQAYADNDIHWYSYIIFIEARVMKYWTFCPDADTVAEIVKAIKFRIDVLEDLIKFFSQFEKVIVKS